jgi:hypothetical protein
MPSIQQPKPSDAAAVQAYLQELNHPMKAEILTIRDIIARSSPKINERIKWNAPSYFYKDDIVTFGPPQRSNDRLMLVFHHPMVVSISSPLLEGTYKDRRLAYFSSMDHIQQVAGELTRIVRLHVTDIDQQEA